MHAEIKTLGSYAIGANDYAIDPRMKFVAKGKTYQIEVKDLGSYEAEERAAILEFEAGYTRQIAESKALAQYASKFVKDLKPRA